MQEGFHQASSKLKLKRRKREVADVHGGRIVRSTGRKDRHSKVCTTSGPKDRRVRLSPNTAIQFYDLQDRLGCDRPSKALDWLMKEAKSAIDALDQSDNLNAANIMQSGEQKSEKGNQDHSPRETFCDQIQHDAGFSTSESGIQTEYKTSDEGHFNSESKIQGRCICQTSQSLPDDSMIMSCYQQGLFSASPSILETDLEMAGFPRHFTCNFTSVNSSTFPPALDQNQFFSQREPLQSSICPTIHALSSARVFSIGPSGNETSKFMAGPSEEKEKEDNPISVKPSFGTSLLQYEDLPPDSPLPAWRNHKGDLTRAGAWTNYKNG